MTQPILITLPVSASTVGLAESLLRHLAFLGPVLNHAILFVLDHGLGKEQYEPLLKLAEPIFPAGGELIHTPLDMAPAYPNAHNFRFEIAARHIAADRKVPWLYLDPHCVPTRKGWLLELEGEYRSHAHLKPIMGQLLTPEIHGTAQNIVSGTAIYPPELPKRMMQRLIAQRGTDWEKSCADLMVPIAHPTQLIWVHPVNGTNALPNPPSIASLVHTTMAKPYAARLRGEPVDVIQPAPKIVQEAPKLPPEKPIYRKPAPIPRTGFYHSGDLGDIVYALAAIKLAGGGALYLGPRSRRTPPPANPMREPVFEMFKPLLEAQPYLSKVIYTDRYPGTDSAFDLNIFRAHWGDKALRARTNIQTLVRMHCHVLGVDEKFHPEQTWITVPDPIHTGLFTCHRSPRYRNDEFPWANIVKRFKGKLLFVGLPQEHAEFQKTFNCRTAFWLCQDFLEMARLISGSLGFIGNQSFPNSLALGMGQRVLQESWTVSPDCVFIRKSFLTQPFTDAQVDKWQNAPRQAPATADKPIVQIVSQPRRAVSTAPINGIIELGPQKDAHGLGDTLCITPLAERLGNRAVMCLPKDMEAYAPLFQGLCQTRITDDYPEFPNPGKERFIESKLRMFGFQCEDGKTVPVVSLTDNERRFGKEGASILQQPIIFHTACAKQWEHVRSRPSEFWKPIVTELENNGFHVLEQFGMQSPLRTLAGNYSGIGLYCGVNTGNWHLAMAVGCKCLVIDADECDGYNPALWRYSLPSVEYVGFDVNNIIAKIPWLLKV